MERLEQRITDLERRASRYRNALVLLVVGLCGVAVVGATNKGPWGMDEDGIITAKELFLYNDAGKVIVGIESNRNGGGLLRVKSQKERHALIVGASMDGNGMLGIHSGTGVTLVWAGVDNNDNGVLRLNSKKGEPRVYLGSGPEDTGFLIGGFNKTGEAVVELMADDYGNGVVGAYDRKGMGRTLEPRP